MLGQYFPILVFIGIVLALGTLMLMANRLIAMKRPDPAKLSSYECGFDPFEDARMPFDVRFYLVAILFIIFDLETAFLFPWAVALRTIGMFGFCSMSVSWISWLIPIRSPPSSTRK